MSYDSQAQEGTETAAHSDDQQTKRGSAWHARAQATKQTGEQTRILRSRLLGRMVLLLLAWSACFSLLCVLFEFSLSDSIGERVADATSTWIYSSLPTEKSLLDAEKNSTVETNDNEDTSEVTRDPWAALGFADEEFMARYDDLASQIGPENVQLMVAADGRLAMRDISFYNTLRSFKIPVAIVIYAIGIIVIIIRTLNRSLRYFNKLSNALADPRLIEGGRIVLPEELMISSQQIELLQKKIRDHEQAAVMAEQRKNELVAYLAHDIRTPLTSVVGYLSLLAESPDLPREKPAEFAGIALSKAERLESLVEEFFEITRYNLNAILLERENVDVALFLDQVADEFGIAAKDRDISITTIAPENKQAFIDSSKMARALGNVVKNAISYADPESEVVLSAIVTDDEIVLATTNQGREISPAHLEAIFERFYREDRSRGQSANAGLGLAIAREIVEAHGGTIGAESSNGLTTFTIRLPR